MKKCFLLFISILLLASAAPAHVIRYELDRLSGGQVIWKYTFVGFEHIIPLGFDHILFIVCVFLLNKSLKQVILYASMFTIAHSITLGLAMNGLITPPSAVVEPLIAFSIVFLAVENIFSKEAKSRRLVMVFVFGMIHGMGFAGALSQLGMPQYAFATALLSFNVGVELGQLSIIFLLYFLVSRPFSQRLWYRKAVVQPISLSIALVAAWWTFERIFAA